MTFTLNGYFVLVVKLAVYLLKNNFADGIDITILCDSFQ